MLGSKTREQVKRRYEQLMAEKEEKEKEKEEEKEEKEEKEQEENGRSNRNARILRSSKETQLNTMKHNSNETDSKLNESGNTNFKHETQSNLPHPSTVSTVSTVSTNASNSPSSSEGRRGRRSRGLAAEGGRSPAGNASSGVSMAGKASTASGGGKRGSKPAVSWTGLEDETLQVLAQTFQFNWDAIAKSRRAERKGMMGRNGV